MVNRVTINADGTIIKKLNRLYCSIEASKSFRQYFYAGVFPSDTSSAAVRATGGSNGSDYLVIGQDQTAEGFLIIVT